MIEEAELLRELVGLRREELHGWIAQGLVAPARRDHGYVYREIDVARVRLIVEIRRDLHIDEDALELILSLTDQLYGVRREMKRLAAAVDAEPEEVRRRIAARLSANRGD